jgi:uncharacterized protein DUF4232
MGSTFRVVTGMGLGLTLALSLLAGCGSSHHASSAGTGSSSTAASPTTASTTPPISATTASSAPASTGPSTTPTTATTASAHGCTAVQLSIQVGTANGAAGSVGYTNDFKNISVATCTLYGYPGLQMLNSSGQPISTDVIRGTSVTVPSVPERLVTLAPGARAGFDMGFASSTGYGSAKCPTSARVEFTAPNDFQSLTVALAIQPYGGPSTAQLHCGQITVSPVYASA